MAQGAPYRPRLSATVSRERPAARGLRRLRLLTAGAAAALAVELLCIPFTSPRFAVREVVLRGDPKVAEQVAARVKLPADTNFFRAPVRLLEERAERVPVVARAEVVRSFPGRLMVTVERREAVAVVRRADQAMLVNPDGVVFGIRDEWGWGLPELVAPHLTKAEVGTAAGRAELAELLAVLRALGPDPRLQVARLERVGENEVEAVLDSGATVRLGGAEQMEAKIKLLAAALDRLGPDQIAYMDLSDPRAPYWRPRLARNVAAAVGRR